MRTSTDRVAQWTGAALLVAVCATAGMSRAALPAAATNQPILFVVRNQYQTDHHNTHTMYPSAPNEISNGYYEGGNSALKVFDPGSGSVRTILDAGADGVIRDPDVHFSGTRILFAWRKNTAGTYHIYEIQSDGTGLKQLTAMSDVDDFDPMYLPDDRIVFVSGREPKYVMCNKHLSHNLYRMDADGANITQIAKSTLFEGHPSLMSDGRVLYDRWEYVDRDFGDAQALWTSDPEGTEHGIYFGNNTSSPGGMIDGHEIPGTQQAVCTFVACHDKPWGAVAVIDRRLARDGAQGVVRTWPAGLSSWVKVDSSVNSDFDIFAATSPKYEDPYPLTDPATGVGGRYFLCSRNTGPGEHMSLYLLDAEDNSATLLHDEGSGDVGCFDPMPLAARPRPGAVTASRKYDDSPGRFYVMDVYKGTHMTGVARGAVKYLRVVESPEKRYYSSQVWNAQGIEAPGVNWDSFETKRILGTVPVEADGSANLMVPPRTFVYFQLLDANGMMVQSMRSGTIIQPGEQQGCVGCHDDRKLAPHPTGVRMPSAFLRSADTLSGWQGAPAKPFNYLAEVQPVFDAKCMGCHDYGGTGAAKVVLAGDKGVCFNASYAELWRKGYTGAIGAGPAEIRPAMSWGSHASRLVQTILGTHTNRVTLAAEEFDRIVTWVDLNAVYYPSYAANYPDNPAGRSPLTFAQLSQLAAYTGANVYTADSVKSLGELISFDRPEKSPCLSGVTGENYTGALALIQAGQAALAAVPREDMANCALANATDVWRESKYQARLCREAMNRAAVAAGVKVYDEQALLAVANGSSTTNADAASATVAGQLVYAVSNETAAVYVAWGSTDGGGRTGAWEHVACVGTQGVGSFTYRLTGLRAWRPYYYRVFAANGQGLVSANATAALDGFASAVPGVYTWSAGTDGAAQDGAGTWDTATAHWVSADGVHAAWCSAAGDTAVFGSGGSAGAVAVDAGVAVGGLIFDAVGSGGYVLGGGPLTLTNTPQVEVRAPAVIVAPLVGSSGFIKTGAETLTLMGGSTFGGEMAIETGTVQLAVLDSAAPPSAHLRLRLDASEAASLFSDAAGSETVSSSGQAVGCWGDLSGGGKPATQSSSAHCPTYRANVQEFNGRPVVQFDGIDDDVTSALDINRSAMSNLTIAIVYRQVAKTANGGLWGHDDGAWDRFQLLNFSNGGAYDGYGVSTGSSWQHVNGMDTNGVLVYVAVLKNGVAGGSSIYINGQADGVRGLSAFTSIEGAGLASLTLGNIGPGGGYCGNVQIGEVLVYDEALNGPERFQVEHYLSAKWQASASPLSFASLKLRLDASDVSTLLTNAADAVSASGQSVATWRDASGSGYDAAQATPAHRPSYLAAAAEFNGHSVVQFDGADDDLTSALDINRSAMSNLTIAIVYRQVAKTANGGLWGHDDGGWDRFQLLNFSNGGAYDGYGVSTGSGWQHVNGMDTNGVLVYMAVLRNGVAGGSSIYINGQADGVRGLSAFTSNEGAGLASLTLGNISPGGGYCGNLQVGEVLVFSEALSDNARAVLERYLEAKWMGVSEAPSAVSVLPTHGSVRIASGALLDLGGLSQTVSSVSGAGAVSNGVLTVTECIAPGGTNDVGTLTLPGASAFSGATLRIDVSASGAGDRLVCSGAASLDGVSLQVADTAPLSIRKSYTVVTSAGRLTGSFADDNLPEGWRIRYSRAQDSGSATLFWASHATVFSVR